jgi:hypothetical protein
MNNLYITVWAVLVLLLVAAGLVAGGVFQAQPDERPPSAVVDALLEPERFLEPITPSERNEILAFLNELVEHNYVMADTARMITAHLRARAAAGAYDDIDDAATLAEVLTSDLQAVNGDRHLYVRHAPPATAGEPVRPSETAPSEGPAAIGFTRAERLEGKVGYIELGGALRQGPSQRRDHALMAEVMNAVDGAETVILDLRRAPGGSAGLANLLVSHFLPPGVHLLTVDSRRTGRMEPRHTVRDVPGPRQLDAPLYVLISGRSFSAAEDIAFSLQSQGRATLVGERTGGGGRNNLLAQLGNGLTASISSTRVLDPRTGEEAWERRGVVPDVDVPASEALDVALRLARELQAG